MFPTEYFEDYEEFIETISTKLSDEELLTIRQIVDDLVSMIDRCYPHIYNDNLKSDMERVMDEYYE